MPTGRSEFKAPLSVHARQRRFLRAAQELGVLQLFSPCRVLSAGIEHKHTGKETHMDTLKIKLAALAGTLFMNTLVMGAVAYCFALQPNTYVTAVALAKAVATQQGLG
jgi:hypothetical protein